MDIFPDTVVRLHDEAKRARQRLLVVLSGEQAATFETAETLLAACKLRDAVILDSSGSSRRTDGKSLLGRDTGAIVIDAWNGFDPDLIGIATGTIRAGGLCILLTPPLDTWPQFPDPQHRRLAVYPLAASAITGNYLARLANIIHKDTVRLAHNSGTECRVLPITPCARYENRSLPTSDQRSLIAAVTDSFDQSGATRLLVSADRGRGKSSALGIAAAELLSGKYADSVIVTAPARSATDNLFYHADITFSRQNTHADTRAALEFYAPDKLLIEQPACSLLIVDEAAAIALPTLSAMLDLYPRVVFSSTQFGYEGAGRGFALRFRAMLDKSSHKWREITLKSPVRYAGNDAVEKFFDRLLMLDASLPTPERQNEIADNLTLKTCSPDQLLVDENLLRHTFALLVEAHYQTRPLDLRHILDGPNLRLLALEAGNQPVAMLLLAIEGELEDTELQTGIVAGKRRPPGHLLPQILAYQHMDSGFLPLRIARIVRIAVHPELQRRGFGSHMLDLLESSLAEQQFDAIGTSFGATDDLLDFWYAADFSNLHLGTKRNASSGCYSAVMFKPLSDRARQLAARASRRHRCVLAHRRKEAVASDLAGKLLSKIADEKASDELGWPEDLLRRELRLYSTGRRDYDSASAALTAFVTRQQNSLTSLPDKLASVVQRRILNGESWQSVACNENLTGKRASETLIRQALVHLIAMNWPESA